MRLRRLAVLALATLLTAGLLALAWRVLSGGGWTAAEALILLCLAANAPWLALSGATGLAGLALRLGSADPAATVLPALRGLPPDAPIEARTVIAVCVRLEDMAAVLPQGAALLAALEAAAPGRFALAILSDTPPGEAAAREAAAVADLAARAPGRVLYRRRAANAGFKAGNLMDFLDSAAARDFDFALVLDADSEMSAAAVLRLVRVMQADAGLAILQPTVAGRGAKGVAGHGAEGDAGHGAEGDAGRGAEGVAGRGAEGDFGRGAETAFARLFGLGHRHGARIWATGQAWWQGAEGPYWGHNALLRIAPFRAHARLPLLPDGGSILSHDHVEAALLHGAGWAVRVLPEDTGSAERHPPDLAAMFARDARWAAGNLQYRHLLHRPDLGRIGRFQMLQAILHYALAPLWFALLPLAALNAASGGGAGTPRDALLGLLGAGALLLHLPKLAGYVETLLRQGAAALRGAPREIAFGLLLDPVAALDRTLTLARLAVAGAGGWAPQRRAARGLSWAEGMRRFGLHAGVGLALAVLFATAGPFALAAALPALAGLLLAVPLAVLTAAPGRPAPAREAARRDGPALRESPGVGSD